MRWLAVVVVLILVVFAAWSGMYPTTSYRFRITLNIETPAGLKSGSSVMEVRTRRYPAWTTLGNNTGESSLKGEAVFIDLGQGPDGKPQNIVALLALRNVSTILRQSHFVFRLERLAGGLAD